MKKEDIEDIYRLSPIQHGMLFHSLYAPESGVYFEQFVFDRGADFDPEVFEQTWRTLVAHHPVLRTCFLWAGLKDPVQVVQRQVELSFDRQDWRDVPVGEHGRRLREYMAEDRRRGFDLAAAPLLRFGILRLAEDSWKILWSYHHLLLDGWSMGLLFREFLPVYRAIASGTGGTPVQQTKRRSFRDYIAWLRQQDVTETEAYWRRTLAGLTAPTPLAVDRPLAPATPAVTDPGRESRSLRLEEAETAELKAWCQRQRVTVSTLVHAAWALLLGRYSQERDVLFGSTVSGRPPALPGSEAMLGCFINTLPVRVKIPPGGRVLPFLQELQARLVELRRYEHSSLVDIQGWSEVPRQVPLFQSIVVVEGFFDSTNEGGAHQRTNYPLALVVGPDREILLRIDYEADHFSAAAVDRLLGHLRTLVTALPGEPERRLEELPVLTPPEREQLLTVWNRPEVRFPSPLPLHRLFEARAAETPEAVAVICEGMSLTYGELNARANRLARYLRRLGAGPESRVGLCLERSLELVVGILGILKAGGAYVPLDPLYPASRLSLIAEDSGLDVLVTAEALRGLVPGGVRSVCLDAAAGEIATESAADLEGGAGPENLAYVIYTSGSTGRPKGSLLTHANVTRLFTATDGWFHFGPQDVWSLFHSFAFDFSVWEIWGALLYGGRLVVVPYWVSRSPEAFHELLVEEGVTVLNQTPSAFRQLVQADGEGPLSLRYVVFGGEALELSSLAPWFDRHGDEKPLLVNMYGITETTVHVTYRVIRREDLAAVGRSPVGVPIPDLSVHLLDRQGHLVPVGVAGEMFVAGAGVARGYLGRPELTAERFVPDPFGGAGDRLYRSGDLARWLESGELEYLGRIDHQVKIRGFRIELGEIEAVLGSHPSVREAVVLLRDSPSGDPRLVGYVVPREGGTDAVELRAFLKDRLPDYMVPSALVETPAVPLTAHGKVDRKALPDPMEASAPAEEGFDPSRTPTEELVAGIWSEVLRVERVGRDDSFFDLGGHSLLATRVLSRLREVLGTELPLRALFEAPTPAELAPRIEAARAAGTAMLPPIEPAPRDGDLPLSFSQERLWFLEELQPGTAVYHIPNAVRMSGALDIEALRRSLAEVVRRHEALRTVFAAKGGRPVQVIREDLQPTMPLVDLSGLPAAETEVRRLSAALSLMPFDLSAGPLLRPALLRLGESEHVLLLTFHHIVADAWSLEVLLRELAALYPAFALGLPSPLPELPVQYADFAAWQRRWLGGALLGEQLAWWRERLAGVPVLQLPADRPRPAVQSHHGSIVPFALPEPVSAAVHALAKARGVTVFMVLLAAYEALLARCSGQEDFAVGSPVAGRDRRETEGLIGFFVNTLVLRSSLAENLEVTRLLDQVRAAGLDAYAHQGVPFERIVQELAPERNLSYPPLFQVMLAFQSLGQEALDLPGLKLSPQSDAFPVSKFDLTLTAFDAGDRIFGHWVYSTALFDRETVARWSGHFQVLLEALAADPSRRVSELPLLGAVEREQVLVEWNRPPVDYPEEGFVHQLFEAQVARTPEAVAVVFEGESLTYRELNARANRLAHRLRREGAGPEVLVGIRVERSFEVVVALLAILKAGSAYLPIDPALPAERQDYMTADAGIGLLLTGDLPDCGEEPVENPAVPLLPDHPAYVIYTSGSTGQPKGVVVSHRALGNRLQYARAGDILASDAFLQKTTISFDVSLLEIFGPLVAGGRTVLARPGGQQDPEYLVRLIREQRITYTSFPPSLLYVLFEQDGFDRCDSLRVVVTGGETVPAVLPGQFYERLPGASLLNRYGPTEATISVTSWLCEREGTPRSLPIGRPTAKTRVYLFDAALQPVPVGITGEIFLGGLCVARGYLGRPELTAEVFVPDPFGGEAGARLYRTGDLARYRSDGAIEFVGRADQQVKIRGFRVELGEIEAALVRHPAVHEAAVIDREDGPSRSLAAYLVWEPGERAEDTALRSFLLESLPPYMVPADFVVLEALPLSSTGKVDHKALPAPRREAGGTGFEEPQGPAEEILAGIFAGLLGLEKVSRTADFFELGGHSLLATRVVARVRELLGVDLALRQLFESPTVQGLAGQVEAARPALPPIVPVPRGEDLPLSFAQERLWFLDQLQPGSPVYNMPAAMRLRGRLDLGALRRSLQAVIGRHEALRTTFAVRGGRAVQVIAPVLIPRMPVVDLQGLSAPAREVLIEELAAAERAVPFDLATGPLLRATLLKAAGEDHVVLLTLHHIVTDGWSMGVLIQEIAELYRAFVTGSAPSLPELPIQYADFAVWQRGWMSGDTLEAQLGYWRQQLAGLPPLLELPTDRPRPAVQTFRGGRHWTPLPAGLAEGLRSLCRAEGATLFMGLLAAFQALLHLYSRQDDLAVGSPVAGRSRLETEPLIGFFVNNLVLRGDLAGNPPFRTLLAKAREAALGAYAHQDLPFEKLVEELAGERSLSHAPLFQVALVLQNTPRQTLELPGMTLSRAAAEGGTSKFDLTLNALETPDGLGVMWSFNRDLFDPATAERLADRFEALLAGFLADPGQGVEDAAVLGPEERAQLLEWSVSGEAGPESLFHELLETQARRIPDRPAVISPEGSLTYRELNARANQLAHRLRRLGVGPEVRVGLRMERSLESVIALFGILKAGGAYVPIDPAHPEDRVSWMLEDAAVSLVLTHLEDLSGESEEAPESGVTAQSLAYVIYTSGSTGRPKGVLVPHRGLGNLSAAQARLFQVTEQSRILQFASLSFDASVAEIALAVRAGAALCLPPKSALLPGAELVELLRRWEITKVTLPPSVASTLPERDFPALRTVVVAGEACAAEVAESWAKDRLFLNAYGPTETTVCATAGAYVPGSGRLSLGTAIPGAAVYVTGPDLHLAPAGVPGELCIGGIGVVRGYSGRPDLTAERFVPDPFSGKPGARLYRSGDLARFQADGTLDFLGRIDQQVKVRGFRIEPGEIENALLCHPAVSEAVAVAREDGRSERRLVAYLVLRDPAVIAAVDWRGFLARSLPDYMVPSAFVVLPDLPRTTSGKVDRRALPAPSMRIEGFVAPQSPLEIFLAGLWKEVLGIDSVGLHDDFFALGGSSITGALLINQLQEKLSEIVHVVVMFDAPTVGQLAAYLRRHYPEAVSRLFGEAGSGESASRRVDEERVAEMLRVIEPLPPGEPPGEPGPKNPPAVFLLSPPRSGSTLFRVMLAGHPGLFAPPELELLSFKTLTDRREAFGERFGFWLEGTTRAVMEIQGCDAETAEGLLADFEAQGWTTRDLYRQIQEWIGGRLLVDKTPSYALDLKILERAEETFENARYIHLLRHPYGMIRSFEEAKLDQVFFRHPHSFSRRELAELIWLVSQRNILRFLEGIPPERQLRVRFEDLLAAPSERLAEVCSFLGIEFRPELAAPYEDKQRRMTDGIHSWSRMLGDVKFHEHSGVDSTVAEKWKSEYKEDFLGEPTWETAAALGYPRRESQWVPLKAVPRDAGTPLPLSFSQERLWFLSQLQPESPAYNLPTAVRLRGKLDVAAFTGALQEIVRRHESLRTRFAIHGGRAVQVIDPELAAPVPVVDLQGLPGLAREALIEALAAEERLRPFDLSTGPLLRATLLKSAAEEHAALLTLHHIVSDGWSMGVLIREIAELYSASVAGRPSPLPDLPVQYADFAFWQRDWLSGEALETQLGYWRRQLAGMPPLLELPTDRPRPAVQSFRGKHHRWAISRPLLDGLEALCRLGHATLFMGLLAVYQAVLQRYTGRDDVVVGTPVAGRGRRETEPLIGLFLNSLVLRTDFSGDPDVPGLLERVRKTTLEAFAHQDLPFEKLVEEMAQERNLSHAPLFQVLLVLQNAPAGPMELPGLTLAPVETEGTTAKFDLTLNARETERGLLLLWLYNSDLFDAATVHRLSGHLETLLAAAVAAPERRLSELPLLTPGEERQILEWNDTAVSYGTDACLHELIEAQVERGPDRVAVVFEGESLTYHELNAAANRLAHRLIGMGVGPEVPVGVFAERSLEMVVGLLAVLKAGGAYLPVDPDYPEDRVAYMLADAAVPVLLTQEHLAGRLAGISARVLLLGEEDGAGEEANPASGVEAGHLAYVIYTSGSTGRPKGAMNTHRGIVNRLLWMQQEYGLTPEDRVLQKTPFSFDVSVWEFFWSLMMGARLVMARPAGHQDAAYLARTIQSEGITTLHFVPSMLQVFLEAPGVEACTSLIRVIASGEALPYELQRRFFHRLGAGLHNLYGPTEAAVDVTYWACEAEGRRGVVPIGRPVANTRIHLLDADLRPVPVGVPGELYIGGVQVARGYLGRPELTAERFTPDPFSAEPGARFYRTGDLARYLPDGAIDFLGRIDHQVKLRGLRIELGEIEAALAAHPSVREAVVLARAGDSDVLGAVSLVAYVTGAEPAPAELRALLARSLPDYMIPAAWVVLGEMPLSPNGKVDRKALSRIAPERTATEPAEKVAPRTEMECGLAALWSEALGVSPDSIGIHDNFFGLGGNSITGAILINRLQQVLGEIVHVVAIFDSPTVASMAASLIRDYPEAVARIWGRESLGEAVTADLAPPLLPLDKERLAEVRSLLRTLAPASTPAPKNPPALFVLSPPRSGSTLLRVMLGGHPGLFAPPELELLNFNTLAERRDAFPGRDAFRLEGLLRAVMEIRGQGPDDARALVEGFESEGMTVQELYRRLQEWIGPRLLVDKTPTYAWDPATLRRAEETFEGARYLHLVRHPYGMIHSFEEARIDQIFFHEDHPFSRRELAEALWGIAHRNVLDFLEQVPEERRHTVRFEDLLGDPEAELRRICGFLGIEYHPDMAEPYKEKSERMTDGLHAESRMLGDVKFHQHGSVQAGVADRWREVYTRDFLGDATWRLAARLGYGVEKERLDIEPGGWREGEPLPLSFAQERLWFFEQMEPGSPVYHIPSAFRLSGRLDLAALEASFREVIRRHASLRTTFSVAEGRPVQTVSAGTGFHLRVIDLSSLAEEPREAEARSLARELLRQPFDFERGPMLRAALLRLGPEEHGAVFLMHHIVSDGWSMGVLIREVAALYAAFSQGRPSPLPGLAVQYPDYALWQRRWLQGERLDGEISYWKKALAGGSRAGVPLRPPQATPAELPGRPDAVQSAGRSRPPSLRGGTRRGGHAVHGPARRVRGSPGPLLRPGGHRHRLAGGQPEPR